MICAPCARNSGFLRRAPNALREGRGCCATRPERMTGPPRPPRWRLRCRGAGLMFNEYAMARWTTAIVGAWLIAALSPSAQPTAGSLDDLRRLFRDPPPESRILMRWWWFGSAVTTPELER